MNTENGVAAVMMIESMACNWSRRSRRYDVFLSLAVVIPAFSMILMRLHSRWVFGGRFEADDFVMMACGVSASHRLNHGRMGSDGNER